MNNYFEHLSKDIFIVTDKGAIYSGNELIIDMRGKIYIFGEFETGLLKMFNGTDSICDIIEKLEGQYPDSFVENEFLDFTLEMIEKGVLIINE